MEFLFIILLIIGVWFAFKYRCSHCKKWFSLSFIRKEVVDEQNISILTEVKTRNDMGEDLYTTEQYIPGTRVTYVKIYQCKYCGNETYRRETKDFKNI